MAGLLGSSQQPQRFGLLAPDAMAAIERARTMPAPVQTPARERGRPGLGTFLMGGRNGLESERKYRLEEDARLRAEAMRPQMEARMAELRRHAQTMGPAAMIAFETNPEKFGESLAEQYAPQVIAAGGIQSVIGDNRRVGAPQSREFGDRIATTDPLTGQTSYTEARPMTAAERIAQQNADTSRFNAENPVLGANATWVGPNGQQRAQGYIAPNVSSVGEGADLVITGPTGEIINRTTNAAEAKPADAQAAAAAEQGRADMAANLQTGLTGARRYVDAAGAWTSMMPWQRQNRANLEGHLETLKGNITFEKLSEMKANSANGASGLGALSDNEARMLASTVAALSPDMSPQELERSFSVIDNLVAKLQQPSPAAAGAAGGVVTVSTPAEAAALPPGTRYRNPQGREFVR